MKEKVKNISTTVMKVIFGICCVVNTIILACYAYTVISGDVVVLWWYL